MPLKLYNTLSKSKETFTPINNGHVGMYVCGPTVYNFAHLGNVRTFLSFDILYRYLLHLGYKVRYVRNITDVGHLVGDADEGEDKIGKIAKLEQLEPMEIVQRYTNDFHQVLELFNLLPPNIEPTATGHIIEQINATAKLIENGFAYESEGSVYFNIQKFNEAGGNYGNLSGRILEDLLNETRVLDGVSEKENPLDFALWKKASPEHIMRWPSPWGEGFPGWHLECTCMSTKYLGTSFDIHGGGMDLKFPHHECEIAQGKALNGLDKNPVNYWLHSNMLTVNGQKMSKSLGNSFLPRELLSGNHPLLDQPYSAMTVRFFMLQAQYRSTLDFSNDALKAAQKAYIKLANALKVIKEMEYIPDGTPEDVKTQEEIKVAIEGSYSAMNDDLNTAIALAHNFTLIKKINMLFAKQLGYDSLGEALFNEMKKHFIHFNENILGLTIENNINTDTMAKQMLELYAEYKANKEYEKVDQIRAYFKANKLMIKDLKGNLDWALEE
jgi:cysteinyl-tRNA synthetase